MPGRRKKQEETNQPKGLSSDLKLMPGLQVEVEASIEFSSSKMVSSLF
jgi:hypothetical protein